MPMWKVKMTLLKVRPVDPLSHNVPIVDRDGRPTPQFMRQWTLARTINLTTDDLSVSVDDLKALIDEAKLLLDQAQAALDALEARQILAGTGLTGGGDLSADRTLAIANTAVAPGSYGGAGQHMAITVNQQGQITSIADV